MLRSGTQGKERSTAKQDGWSPARARRAPLAGEYGWSLEPGPGPGKESLSTTRGWNLKMTGWEVDWMGDDWMGDDGMAFTRNSAHYGPGDSDSRH